MTNKQLKLLKLILVSGAVYYFYHQSKNQGKSLAGRVNTERLASFGAEFLPEAIRPVARRFGKNLIDGMITPYYEQT